MAAIVFVLIIGKLFGIEQLSKVSCDTPAQLLARRQRDSQPVVDELRAWLDEQRPLHLPKGSMGEALTYLHNQWNRLTLFLEDPEIELTNNRSERELRRLVLGTNNWLFVYETIGAKRTANILTIVGTCIAHGVNPRAYLHEVTRRILANAQQQDLDDLLPDRLAAQMPSLWIEPP